MRSIGLHLTHGNLYKHEYNFINIRPGNIALMEVLRKIESFAIASVFYCHLKPDYIIDISMQRRIHTQFIGVFNNFEIANF